MIKLIDLTSRYYKLRGQMGRSARKQAERTLAELQQTVRLTSEETGVVLLGSTVEVHRMAGCHALWETRPDLVQPVLQVIAAEEPMDLCGVTEEEEDRRAGINNMRLDATMMLGRIHGRV